MLDSQSKKEIDQCLAEWMEVQDRRKELSAENSAILERAATIIQSKKGKMTKLFRILRKKMEEGEDEIQEMQDLVDIITN